MLLSQSILYGCFPQSSSLALPCAFCPPSSLGPGPDLQHSQCRAASSASHWEESFLSVGWLSSCCTMMDVDSCSSNPTSHRNTQQHLIQRVSKDRNHIMMKCEHINCKCIHFTVYFHEKLNGTLPRDP